MGRLTQQQCAVALVALNTGALAKVVYSEMKQCCVDSIFQPAL